MKYLGALGEALLGFAVWRWWNVNDYGCLRRVTTLLHCA